MQPGYACGFANPTDLDRTAIYHLWRALFALFDYGHPAGPPRPGLRTRILNHWSDFIKTSFYARIDAYYCLL